MGSLRKNSQTPLLTLQMAKVFVIIAFREKSGTKERSSREQTPGAGLNSVMAALIHWPESCGSHGNKFDLQQIIQALFITAAIFL